MEDVAQSGPALLAAARAGDEDAFDALVGPFRPELQAHCYRMLGSLHDAEDVLQEVLVRAWRGLDGFEGRSSVRAWLYRIATNASLSAIDSRARRILPVDHRPVADESAGEPPLAEMMWIGPYPHTAFDTTAEVAGPAARYEQKESLELAFIAALQHLPGNQRAALILRDVLGFSAADAAEVLETTTTSVNSALQHARSNAADRIPPQSQQSTLESLGDDQLRGVAQRYMRAFEDADLEALISLLAADATWSMPPAPEWYQGHPAIKAFLTSGPLTERWRHVPTRANGQLAIGCYMWDPERDSYVGHVLDVLSLDGDHITAVTAFIDDTLFEVFGLPVELPA